MLYFFSINHYLNEMIVVKSLQLFRYKMYLKERQIFQWKVKGKRSTYLDNIGLLFRVNRRHVKHIQINMIRREHVLLQYDKIGRKGVL